MFLDNIYLISEPGLTEEGALSEQLLTFVKKKINVSSGIFSLHQDFDRDL